ELDCKMQSISASIAAVCRKPLQNVNRDSGQSPRPRNSVKNYISLGGGMGSDLHFTHFFTNAGSLNLSAPLWSFSRVRRIICETAVYPAPPNSSPISSKLNPQQSHTNTTFLGNTPLRFDPFSPSSQLVPTKKP